jgi:hypothetical protein
MKDTPLYVKSSFAFLTNAFALISDLQQYNVLGLSRILVTEYLPKLHIFCNLRKSHLVEKVEILMEIPPNQGSFNSLIRTGVIIHPKWKDFNNNGTT